MAGHDMERGSNVSRNNSSNFRVVSNSWSNNNNRNPNTYQNLQAGSSTSGSNVAMGSNSTVGNNMSNVMGMGMGGMGMGMMFANPYNPLYWIQTVNFTIMQISQMIQIFGMSTTALGVTLLKMCKVILSALRAARKSKYMIWLQEKSKKSSLFKWSIIFFSMVVTSTVCNLVRAYIHRYCGCNSTSVGLLKMLDSLGLSHLLPTSPGIQTRSNTSYANFNNGSS